MAFMHDIEFWPPGSWMKFEDVFSSYPANPRPGHEEATLNKFISIGIVIANDGIGQIRVLWGANCREVFKEYEVKYLNDRVISRVML